MRDAAQARRNAELLASEVPGELWEELKACGLLRADVPIPPPG
jgi:D-threo-aldose 1-dehydrogenase